MPTKAELQSEVERLRALIPETPAGDSVPQVPEVRARARALLYGLLPGAASCPPEDRAGLASLLLALQSVANL